MDKPDLVVCAIIGDGEAETGPTATSGYPIIMFDLSDLFIGLGTLPNTSIRKSQALLFQSSTSMASRSVSAPFTDVWIIQS
jgi:XFP N-terminal domain